MPRYDAVLWDFGDTLVDQTWMLECPIGISQWREVFVEQIWNGELGLKWNRGTLSVDEVALELSRVVRADPARLLSHFRECCRRIRFHAGPMAVVKRARYRHAMVTVNPDIFTRWIVPDYRLGDLFDPVVVSWQVGTVEKSELCYSAVSDLGEGIRKERVLLIDNIEANVQSWCDEGGLGYHFTGNQGFEKDAPLLFGVSGAV